MTESTALIEIGIPQYLTTVDSKPPALFLEQVVRDHTVSVPTVSAEAWETEFEAWVVSFPEVPALSDEAISRESMYPDRW